MLELWIYEDIDHAGPKLLNLVNRTFLVSMIGEHRLVPRPPRDFGRWSVDASFCSVYVTIGYPIAMAARRVVLKGFGAAVWSFGGRLIYRKIGATHRRKLLEGLEYW